MPPSNQPVPSPQPQVPTPAAPPPVQSPQPAPVQPPVQPVQPVAPPPATPVPPLQAGAPKKKTAMWLIIIIAAVSLIVIASIAFVIVKKPKDFTGTYSRFGTYTPEKPSDGGDFTFKYPANMVPTRQETNRVTFEQKAKPDQTIKSQNGWESRVVFSAVTGKFGDLVKRYEKSSLDGNNEVIIYLGNVHKKVLEEDGMTDVTTEPRGEFSNTASGKAVYDYTYRDKNGTLIKGRHITFLSETAVFGLSIEAVDKIWDAQTPAWDDITESFEVKPLSS